jgi:DNA-binding Lrp family transcriptional regulator
VELLKEWPSVVTRAGQRFEPIAERGLDRALRQLAVRLPGANSGVHVVPEFVGPNGVADLVALTGDEAGLQSRIQSEIPYLHSVTDAVVAEAFSINRTVTVARAAIKIGMSEKQVGTIARRLVRTGVLKPVGSGFRRDPRIHAYGRMYALEAKVSDWPKALTQAMRYATWTDAVGVVLLRTPRDLARAKSRASSLNVGLAIEDRWVVRPKIKVGRSPLRLLGAERFAASIAAGQKSLPETLRRSVGPQDIELG